MRITVNGDQYELPDATTIAGLLEVLQLDPRFLAVERNRQLIPRAEHASCQLREGDEVEIVTLVGGG